MVTQKERGPRSTVYAAILRGLTYARLNRRYLATKRQPLEGKQQLSRAARGV